MTDTPEFTYAVQMQREAANPVATRLASANAGSGKTRVLVNRVSRILLTETKPEKILCLTYTKAAASEMQTRLFETLGKWSILPKEQLRDQLRDLLPDNVVLPKLSIARSLFAEALETPEGLKVQTIHAFCERILSRFPIEAGILPGFEPIDDADMQVLQERVRDDLIRAAAKKTKSDLSQAIQLLAAEKADQTLDELFKWMAMSPDKIESWVVAGGTAGLAKILGISDASDLDNIKREAWQGAPHADLKMAASGMLNSGKPKEEASGQTLSAALAETDPLVAFDLYASVVFKADMTPNSQIASSASGSAAKNVFGAWSKTNTSELDRMAEIGQTILSVKTLAMTKAFMIVAVDYAARFKQAKREQRGLDFNDQILLVKDLLLRKEVSDWVRYKLDGGIEHILVDEAQDTSPEQWDIIDSLAEAFIQDSPDRDKIYPRTLFAVGDEKQSIYSFQGAKPERFLNQIKSYVGDKGKAINMRMSFRSAQEILNTVDAFLNGPGDGSGALMRMFDIEEFPPAGDVSAHTAFRTDHGRVDLWPAVPRPEKDEENAPWDTRPVNAIGQSDSREQLASAIAKQIKAWIDTREPIFDRDLSQEQKRDVTRPMQAGDILILVRQRNAFFDAIIRNLKKERVPVAGADRLKLKNSIAVKDLLSLAKFTLLPGDDLSLAEVLKCPLFGWDDDDLLKVAYDRNGSLWASTKKLRPETARTLQDIIEYSRRFAPYEFFAGILDMSYANGESGLKRMYMRLGLEAKDAIEAFLARALAHQRRGFPSLQHFVQNFLQDEQELKREMDMCAGQVRVMTVHGAKGLEAPVVFLPDTTQVPTKTSSTIPVQFGYVLTPSSKETPAVVTEYKEGVKARMMQEYLRLLYVAMTRAESRLVICGFKHGQNLGSVTKNSWYIEAQKAFEHLDTQTLETPFGDGLSYGVGAEPAHDIAAIDRSAASLPPWIDKPAAEIASLKRHVTPSHLLSPKTGQDMPVRSPLSVMPTQRFQRGNIIHKLLEFLPEFDVSRRDEIAANILGTYDIDEDMRAEISMEVFAVLEHPDFAAIFAPGSRAEVSLAGTAQSLPKDLYLNAQIDRLSVTDTDVFIVDYKSNRPPPTRQADVPDIYWGQMAAYRALAQEIYPDKNISCALLWTDGPHMMILDDERLDKALTQIHSLPT